MSKSPEESLCAKKLIAGIILTQLFNQKEQVSVETLAEHVIKFFEKNQLMFHLKTGRALEISVKNNFLTAKGRACIAIQHTLGMPYTSQESSLFMEHRGEWLVKRIPADSLREAINWALSHRNKVWVNNHAFTLTLSDTKSLIESIRKYRREQFRLKKRLPWEQSNEFPPNKP